MAWPLLVAMPIFTPCPARKFKNSLAPGFRGTSFWYFSRDICTQAALIASRLSAR